MADATRLRDASPLLLTMQAAASQGEMRQLADGSAGWLNRPNGAANNDAGVGYTTTGVVTLTKTPGICFLDGGPAFWDFSAAAAHFKQVDDQDFEIGSFVGDAASGDTTCAVNLNVKPRYKNDLARESFTPVAIGTPAESVLWRKRGGSNLFTLDATNEAQKIDARCDEGWAIAANAILEARIRVVADDSGTGAVFSIGMASTTHATAFASIAHALGIQVKAHDGKIYAVSNAVPATDSTKTYAVGTRFEIWIDTRVPTACKLYVDGVQVLSGTTFDISSATTLYLLAHLVKASSTDTMQVAVDSLRERTARQ